MQKRLVASLLVAVAALSVAIGGCRRAPAAASDASVTPTLRLYVVSTAAGALEPCGCTKDMLGGADHLSAFVRAGAKEAPHSLVVGAGPMLFMNPKIEEARRAQDQWKAEAIAAAFSELGIVAWAPGANDWALGASELERLSRVARADLLAANLKGASAGAKPLRVVETNGLRVGIVGASTPMTPLGPPAGVEVADARAAFESGLTELERQKADVKVALVAADRGQAMRLAEQVPGFHVVVAGKPYDQGEANDAELPPALVGETLVVEAPNHLQGVAVIDLFVRGDLHFKDGSGIDRMERRQSLESRIRELETRIADWSSRGVAGADLAARRDDLAKLKAELAKIQVEAPPAQGSFFRYRLQEVRENLGSDPEVGKRILDYYQRVNDHNREAFKDRLPPTARPGEATYIGAEACSNCHAEEYAFWKGTPHFHAYASLSTQHKEFNLDCVSCHVTGYEKPGGSTVTHVAGFENVQCEVCHGPGSRHEDTPSDTSAIVASPPKTLCAGTCHHPPHVPAGWNPDDAWKVIVGKGHGRS
jgi:2',3'-cyclic-nucleotide 2'-phosphodiesterase (5'-nucleotidase family)